MYRHFLCSWWSCWTKIVKLSTILRRQKDGNEDVVIAFTVVSFRSLENHNYTFMKLQYPRVFCQVLGVNLSETRSSKNWDLCLKDPDTGPKK